MLKCLPPHTHIHTQSFTQLQTHEEDPSPQLTGRVVDNLVAQDWNKVKLPMDDPHVVGNGHLLLDMLAGLTIMEMEHGYDLSGWTFLCMLKIWAGIRCLPEVNVHPTLTEAPPLFARVSGSRRPAPPCSCISSV